MMAKTTSLWTLAAICTLSVSAQASSAARDLPQPTVRERLERHATQLQRARDLASWTGIRADTVQRLLRDSRLLRDDARATCLDEALSQLHAVERQAVAAEALIRDAALAGSDRRIGAQMARMQVLSERSRLGLAKAESCGREVSERVRMRTGYTVRVFAPSLPDDDLVQAPTPVTAPRRRPAPRRWAGADTHR